MTIRETTKLTIKDEKGKPIQITKLVREKIVYENGYPVVLDMLENKKEVKKNDSL